MQAVASELHLKQEKLEGGDKRETEPDGGQAIQAH